MWPKKARVLEPLQWVAHFPDKVWEDYSILQLFIKSTGPIDLDCGDKSKGCCFYITIARALQQPRYFEGHDF